MLVTDYDKSHLDHLPRIIIDVVDHEEQRYPTCGDWFWNENGELVINVSKTNTKYEFLIALHEITEAMLCHFKGISPTEVDDFDIMFENMRKDFPKIVGVRECGDDETAPYHHEHLMASRIENWIADSIMTPEEKAKYVETIDGL